MMQEPEPINWKAWKDEGVDAQLVDAFQKAYDSASSTANISVACRQFLKILQRAFMWSK